MKPKVEKYYDKWTIHYLNSGYGNVIQAHRPTNVEDLHEYTAKSARIKDGMKILDVGCGVCGPTIYFVEHFDIQISGFAISEEHIKYAKKSIAEKNLDKKIKLVKGEFHNLHKYFKTEEFDLILMLEAYGHAANQSKLLHSAEKILKKNGHIYIKEYFQKEINGSLERKRGMKKAINNMNRVYAYNLPDLTKTIHTLRKLNLELVEINRHRLPLDNKNSVEEFEQKHGIDLFEGGFHYQILEPLELYFKKLADIDEPII
jgi:ubiquinone/menaquinone biosynthesis C-methylase UbiE